MSGGEGVEAVEGDGEGALLPVPGHPVMATTLAVSEVVGGQLVAAVALLSCTGCLSSSYV